jgi:hypothetical protein
MDSINALNSIFSENDIIFLLCRYRISLANKRHKNNLFDQNTITNDCQEELLCTLLPPRRQWIREKDRRDKLSTEVKMLSLYKTVIKKRKNKCNDCWNQNLNNFINDIKRKLSLDDCPFFENPEILFIHKKDHIYRLIAKYDLIDRIIDSLTAKYLSHLFDEFFLPSSMAYRIKQNNKIINHNDALKKIINFHKQFRDTDPNKELWVAECDIENFYDTVNHQIAIDSFEAMISKCSSTNKSISDEAIKIYRKFIGSFSFSEQYKQNQDKLMVKDNNGYCKWPEKKLIQYYFVNPNNAKIGIPQGAALSCLTANLILHNADNSINELGSNSQYCYIRYCDDMILIHSQKNGCEELFNEYLKKLKELKLVYHKPITISKYNKYFWEYKSKNPYCWGKQTDKAANAAVPWISFVGYQLDFKGNLRIRRSTIEKEMKKQKRELYLFQKQLQNIPIINRSTKSIIEKVKAHLIAMAVGKRNWWSNLSKLEKIGWAAGFDLLKENSLKISENKKIKSQLSALDKNREKMFSVFKSKNRSLLEQKSNNVLQEKCLNKQLLKKQKKPRYYGKPYSYYGQFIN